MRCAGRGVGRRAAGGSRHGAPQGGGRQQAPQGAGGGWESGLERMGKGEEKTVPDLLDCLVWWTGGGPWMVKVSRFGLGRVAREVWIYGSSQF